MRGFIIFLLSGGGVLLFAITEIYPEFGTPAIRTVFRVGGVVMFVGTWLYVAVERALRFAHGVKKMRGSFKQGIKNNPFKNFLLSLLFILVASAFFAFGIFVKQGYSPFGRVILLVVSGALILLGIATAAHHFWNMVRRRK